MAFHIVIVALVSSSISVILHDRLMTCLVMWTIILGLYQGRKEAKISTVVSNCIQYDVPNIFKK